MEGCIFCKIVKGEIPAEKVLESKNFIVFWDDNPRTKGHSLVIPKEHYKDILELPEKLYKESIDTIKKAAKKLLKETNSDGFNLLMNTKKAAGQVVFHMHAHIIPRKDGDGADFFKDTF